VLFESLKKKIEKKLSDFLVFLEQIGKFFEEDRQPEDSNHFLYRLSFKFLVPEN
jgi:hypothetical protein